MDPVFSCDRGGGKMVIIKGWHEDVLEVMKHLCPDYSGVYRNLCMSSNS